MATQLRCDPAPATGWMIPRPFRVARVRRETQNTVTLELDPVEDPLPRFTPGQFNMLDAFGTGEVPISISGDPATPERLVHTVRAVGAATQAICARKPGSILGVRGPFGSSWPFAEAVGRDVVMVAGGLGLAPMRPFLYHVLSHREEYGRVALLGGSRTPADLLYARELEKWRRRADLDVQLTVDVASPDWPGNVGVVTTLLSRVAFNPAEAVAMLCGPEVMMRFTILELQRRGVAPDQIYLSMERNMKCAVGFCGHCQFGPTLLCRDGPILRYDRVEPFFKIREV